MNKIKWMNIPIPPQHLVGLLLGAYLQFKSSFGLFSKSWIGLMIGFPLIIIGIWISLKSAYTAGEMNIGSPTELLTSGPYSFSRNPMYVGWTLIYLGVALSANSIWIALFLPIIFIYTYLVDIRKEEQILEAEFGDQYLEYKQKVRRYL